MHKIVLEKSVQKFLKKHIWWDVVVRFQKATELLSRDPYCKDLDISALIWYAWRYRLRIWKYRFLYTVDESNVVVIFFDAGPRGDIYK